MTARAGVGAGKGAIARTRDATLRTAGRGVAAYICFVASTTITPEKRGQSMWPARSQAAAERNSGRQSKGGTKRAASQHDGENMDSRKSCVI